MFLFFVVGRLRLLVPQVLLAGCIMSIAPVCVVYAAEEPSKQKANVEKGTLDDVRQIVDLARDIRDLIKSVPAGDLNKAAGRDKSAPGHQKLALNAAEIREFIGLARDVRDLVKDFPKSTKSVSVPDLSGLLTYVGPIYDAVKATPDAGGDKIGLADVAAAVALAREIRDLTKSAPAAKLGDKIVGIDDLAAAVAIASEVRNLFKSLPIDETRGIRLFSASELGPVDRRGVFIEVEKAAGEANALGAVDVDIKASTPRAIFEELREREASFLLDKDAKKLNSAREDLEKALDHRMMADPMLPSTKAIKRFPTLDLDDRHVLSEEVVNSPSARFDRVNFDQYKNISDSALINLLNQDLKLVYGKDDRKDLFTVENTRTRRQSLGIPTTDLDHQLENARSVCCIVNQKNKVTPIPNTSKSLIEPSKYNVCGSENFAGQPVISQCTGFIVSKDIIATAGHCIKDDASAKNSVFIFDFRMPSEGSLPSDELIIDNGRIFRGVELLGRQEVSGGLDWALVRVDREITGRKVLELRTNASISNNSGVYTIGHPCGLPAKIADNAQVLYNSSPEFFVADLDTYGGNSGSPVFSAITHQVEGILVRGGQDFQLALDRDTQCYKSVYVPSSRFDLRLISSLNDAAGIPNEGRNLIIVAAVKGILHIRLFDGGGTMAADNDEKTLAEQIEDRGKRLDTIRRFDELRKKLKGIWPPQVITEDDKFQVIRDLTSIIGYPRGEDVTRINAIVEKLKEVTKSSTTAVESLRH